METARYKGVEVLKRLKKEVRLYIKLHLLSILIFNFLIACFSFCLLNYLNKAFQSVLSYLNIRICNQFIRIYGIISEKSRHPEYDLKKIRKIDHRNYCCQSVPVSNVHLHSLGTFCCCKYHNIWFYFIIN